MDTLSSKEADFLRALSMLKDQADIDKITHLLLAEEELQQEDRLIFILDKLKDSKWLETKKINLFDFFIVTNFNLAEKSNKFIKNIIYNYCADFKKKILSFFKKHKKKKSKYEIRFFWPANINPDIYDLGGLVFNKEYYTHHISEDKYIITDYKNNIKIRENELQIKSCVKKIDNISQFKKKKRMSFPLKGKKINALLEKNVFSDSAVFETTDDLLNTLSNLPTISCIDVIKERYVRKMEDHIKIELSLIKIQEKEWKTICIESKHIEKIQSLSLLINQENAEILNYDEFLRKYGRVDLNKHQAK